MTHQPRLGYAIAPGAYDAPYRPARPGSEAP